MKESLFIRWLPVLLWAIFIFVSSANPNPYKSLPASWARQTVTVQATLGQKRFASNELLGRYLHAAEYLVLAALVARALVWQGYVRLELMAIAFGVSAVYALSDEIHQLFVPGRAFQLSDLALDLFGSVLGVVTFAFFLTLWRRRVR
jgi:VanZ family protein